MPVAMPDSAPRGASHTLSSTCHEVLTPGFLTHN